MELVSPSNEEKNYTHDSPYYYHFSYFKNRWRDAVI